ncbi:MAG: lipoprotein N-acyltransferase Lnb domain-containing protein [Rhodanobacter sp.]
MRHFIFALGLAMLWLLLTAPAQAGVANAPGANLQVALITYGPGETYWERFGHVAIEVRDNVSGEAVSFNYGEFDFNQKDFFLNFARGHMSYTIGASLSNVEESYYVESGRSITRQLLAFDAEQAGVLRDYLLWNLRPENAGYSYDYYADNCSTRVRDVLDKVLNGALKKQLQAHAGNMTYRQQTARLMSAQPWLMLVLDLGLGPYADTPLTAWQESFIPMALQTQLNQVRIDDGHGGLKPLIQSETLVSPNRLDTPPSHAPDLRFPLALAGLLIAILLVLAWRYWHPGYLALGTIFLFAAGLVGIVLLALWTLTSHQSAWANANLLLFNPLAWLLLPTLWRTRRSLTASRFIDGVLALQLLAAMTAIGLHLLPGSVQQNQPWILFALPLWLALAWSLRRPR